MAEFALMVGQSVSPSVHLFLSQSVQFLSVFSLSVCMPLLWPVQLSARSSSWSIYSTVTCDCSCLVMPGLSKDIQRHTRPTVLASIWGVRGNPYETIYKSIEKK